MRTKTMPLGAIAANCTVAWNETADGAPAPCWIVDPGADAPALVAWLEAHRLRPVLVALTHGHFDHVGGVPGLLANWPDLPVHVGPADAPMLGHPLNRWEPDYPLAPRPATLAADLADGFELSAGGLSATVLATPGHTPGGVCLRFARADAAPLLLTGDTLFAGSCGRTDFPGGDAASLSRSLARLAALEPETEIVCGHGASSTIGRERAANPFVIEAGRRA